MKIFNLIFGTKLKNPYRAPIFYHRWGRIYMLSNQNLIISADYSGGNGRLFEYGCWEGLFSLGNDGFVKAEYVYTDKPILTYMDYHQALIYMECLSADYGDDHYQRSLARLQSCGNSDYAFGQEAC